MKKLSNGISLATGFFVVLGLAGCNDRSVEDEARSVGWYQANKTERATKLAQCESSSDNSDASPDCINASRAESDSKAAIVEGQKDVITPASIYD